jgi:hypothetical protein
MVVPFTLFSLDSELVDVDFITRRNRPLYGCCLFVSQLHTDLSFNRLVKAPLPRLLPNHQI